MRVLLVDPSLFTAPYDSFLSEGIAANGVVAKWATRSLRLGEDPELPSESVEMVFYRLTEGARRRSGSLWKYVKGLEHALDLRRLERAARGFDLVHFQFSVLPRLDLSCIRRLRQTNPVVLTIHDTTPFNGTTVNPLQSRGLEDVFHAVDHLVVLTEGAKETIVSRGIPRERISVIGHGPLALRTIPEIAESRSAKWQIVFFGRIQAYKGLGVLIEAAALLSASVRSKIEIVVAGEAFIDVAPFLNRVKELKLAETLDMRLYRLSEKELASLLAGADAFVFPYLQIDSSGALFLALGYKKWIIASEIGAFKDVLSYEGALGALVPPGDPISLARALAESIDRAPVAFDNPSPSWTKIGDDTVKLYEKLLEARKAGAQRTR